MSVKAILSSARILDQLAARARKEGGAVLSSYGLQDQLSPSALILTLTNSKSHTNLYDAFASQDLNFKKPIKGLFDTVSSTDFTTKRNTKGLFDTASSSEYVVAGATKIKTDTANLIDTLRLDRASLPVDRVYSSEIFKILVYPEPLPPAYAVTQAIIDALRPYKGLFDTANLIDIPEIMILIKRLSIVNASSLSRKYAGLAFTFDSLYSSERRTDKAVASATIETKRPTKGLFDTPSITVNTLHQGRSSFTKELLGVESGPRKKASLSFKEPVGRRFGSFQAFLDRPGSFFTIENEHSTQRSTKGLFDTPSITVNTLHQGRSSFTKEVLGVSSGPRPMPSLTFKGLRGSLEQTRDKRGGSFSTIEERYNHRPTKGLFDTTALSFNVLHQGRSSFTQESLNVQSGPRNKPMLEFKNASNHADRPGDFIESSSLEHGKLIGKGTRDYTALLFSVLHQGSSNFTQELLNSSTSYHNKPMLEFKELEDTGRQGVWLTLTSTEQGKEVLKALEDALLGSEYTIVARPVGPIEESITNEHDVRKKTFMPLFDHITTPTLVKKLLAKSSVLESLETGSIIVEAGYSQYSIQRATITSLNKKYVKKERFDQTIEYEDLFKKLPRKGYYDSSLISSNIETLGASSFTKEVLDVESGPRKLKHIELKFEDRPLVIKNRYQIQSGVVNRTQRYITGYNYTYDGDQHNATPIYGIRATEWRGVFLNNVEGISTAGVTRSSLRVISRITGHVLFEGRIIQFISSTGKVVTENPVIVSGSGYDDNPLFDPGNKVEIITNWTRKLVQGKTFRPTYVNVLVPVYNRRGELTGTSSKLVLSSYWYQTTNVGFRRDYETDRQQDHVSVQSGRAYTNNWGGFGLTLKLPFRKNEYINASDTVTSAKNTIRTSAASLVSPDILEWVFLLAKFDNAQASEFVAKYITKAPVYDNVSVWQDFFESARMRKLSDAIQSDESSSRIIKPRVFDKTALYSLVRKYLDKYNLQDLATLSNHVFNNRLEFKQEVIESSDSNYTADIEKPLANTFSLVETVEREAQYKRAEEDYLELQDTRDFFGHTYATADCFGEQYVGLIINRV